MLFDSPRIYIANSETPHGGDFFTRLHPERAKSRAMHQREAMGYHVTLHRVG